MMPTRQTTLSHSEVQASAFFASPLSFLPSRWRLGRREAPDVFATEREDAVKDPGAASHRGAHVRGRPGLLPVAPRFVGPACPDDHRGPRVDVEVSHNDGRITLSVWNSGAGISPDFGVAAAGRTGLALVHSIVTGRCGGSFPIAPSGAGALARVTIEDAMVQEAG